MIWFVGTHPSEYGSSEPALIKRTRHVCIVWSGVEWKCPRRFLHESKSPFQESRTKNKDIFGATFLSASEITWSDKKSATRIVRGQSSAPLCCPPSDLYSTVQLLFWASVENRELPSPVVIHVNLIWWAVFHRSWAILCCWLSQMLSSVVIDQ